MLSQSTERFLAELEMNAPPRGRGKRQAACGRVCALRDAVRAEGFRAKSRNLLVLWKEEIAVSHFLVLSNRNDTVLHGVVCDVIHGFKPLEADEFSAKYNLTKCVYHESYENREQAMARLAQFSKWSRSKKEALVGASNPARRDLTAKVYRHEEHL